MFQTLVALEVTLKATGGGICVWVVSKVGEYRFVFRRLLK